MKKFALKLKNKIVLSLEWNNEKKTFENIVFSKEFLFLEQNSAFNQFHLNNIILNENILPTQRLKKIINHKKNVLYFYSNDYGLNLNNAFWLVPYNKKSLKWEENNYFDNYKYNFIDALQKIYDKPSPNIYTVGDMEKFWFFDKERLYLAKQNSYMFNDICINDVQSEYLAYQISDFLYGSNNEKVVKYKLLKHNKKWYSISEIFVSQDVSFIPLSWLINYDEINKQNILNLVKKIYGSDELEDLMVFDAIILNIDRHLGNLGILIDNEKLNKIKNAPIFDNGRSLVFDYPLYKSPEARVYLENYLNIKPKFYDSFKEQFLDNVKMRHIEWFNKLKNFKFKNNSQNRINSKYINKAQEIFNKQMKIFEDVLRIKKLI